MYSSFYEFVLLFLSILTITIQCYVVYLVQNKSPKSMKDYRFFLNMFSFWDLLFTLILGLFLQAIPITPMLAGVPHGVSQYLGDFGNRVTVSLAIYAGANVMMCQDMCLMYRFCVIHPNKMVFRAFMSVWFKAGILLFSQLLSIALTVAFYQTLLPNVTAHEIISKSPEEIKAQVKPTDLIIFIEFGFPFTQKLFLIIVALFMLSEMICITLIYLIMSILRENAGLFSKNTYKLHVQFTVLLAVQLMTPIVFIVAPITVCIIAVFMAQPSTEEVTEIGLTMLTLYGMTNSLFTILFVSPYRNHAFNTFILPWLRPLFDCFGIRAFLPKQGQPIPSMTVSNTNTNLNSNAIGTLGRRSSVFVSRTLN